MARNTSQTKSIEGLIETIEDIWHVEKGYAGFRTYMFSFKERDIGELLLKLVLEFAEVEIYKVRKGHMREAHRELYAEFTYKEPPKLKNRTQIGIFQPHKNDKGTNDSTYFARTYIIEPNSDEITRYSRKIQPVSSGNKILVIDVRTDRIHREAVDNFLKTFYAVYNDFKTPSKT